MEDAGGCRRKRSSFSADGGELSLKKLLPHRSGARGANEPKKAFTLRTGWECNRGFLRTSLSRNALGTLTGERTKPVLTRRSIRNSFGAIAEVSHAEPDRRNSLLGQFD
jgi:hypothetical protein